MDDGRPHLKLAFLGPRGTYSHQVAHDAFGDEVEYHSCKTIAETYHSVGSDFALGVIPHENSIFGTVVETYDLLRDLELGKSKWVRGALMLPIQHSLLVHRNRRLPDIKKVLSHEQALGQCSRFLQEQLPNAELVAVSSTAAAAERVSKDVEAFDHAAICSDFCTKLLPDLEVLHKGIQNEQRNFTRFYILSNREHVPLPRLATTDTPRHALLRVQPQLALVGHSLTIEQILRPLGMFISRIDRRPSQEREPFDDIYILEIFDTNTSEDLWENAVRQGMKRVVDVGGEVALLGLW